MRFWPRNKKRFKRPVMVQLTVEQAEELSALLDITTAEQTNQTLTKFKEGLAKTAKQVREQ